MRRSFGRPRPSRCDAADSPATDGQFEAPQTRHERAAPDHSDRSDRSGRRRGFRLGAALAVVGLTATACEVPNFGFPDGVTNQTPRILNIWQGSVIAALAVGVFVWGLIFYAIIVFRKKTDELPRQIRYNLPVEALYTMVPVVIIAGIFYYTARDEIEINKLSDNPDVTVNVVAFRWNWQFRYADTGVTGGNEVPIEVTGRTGEPAMLVLPVDRTIRFVETSPDVIHSFWVPEFLFKRDVVPGRVNQFELTITKTGTFVGRCAELCGTDHDRMNFFIKVVPQAEYDQFVLGLQRVVPAAGDAAAQPAGGTAVLPAGGTALLPTGVGAQPTGGTAAQPTGGTAAQPTGGTAAQPTGGTAAQPTAGTAAQPTGGTAAQPTAEPTTAGSGQ